jgi:hypothetical protein
MATKAVAAAPEAISDQSAKTQIADRRTETQTVVDTTHADITTTGNALSVAGESQQDAEHISPAPTDNAQFVESDTAVSGIATTKPIVSAASARPEDDLGAVPTDDAPRTQHDSGTQPSDQSAPLLTSEQANALFPIENYGAYTTDELHGANLENFKESKHLHGKFTAHLYDRVLPAINESIKRLKEGTEINGFSGERQVGAYLESIGYTADLVRQWNKRYRDRMAKLKKVLGLATGNSDDTLTPEQRELRDTLIQQGYKNPDATRLAKAAEGNSVSERFNWVMAHRAAEISGAGTDTTTESTIEPATETSKATEPGAVTTVTDVDAGELDEDRESDSTISSLEKEITRLNAENENLQQRLAAINAVPENLRNETIAATLAAEPDTAQAGKFLTAYFTTVGERVLPPGMALVTVNVIVRLVGRESRIMPGDFLEKQTKQRMPPTLCKCTTEVSDAGRQKVIEWVKGHWAKSHVIYSSDGSDYRVITEEAARVLAPEAFPTLTPPEGL